MTEQQPKIREQQSRLAAIYSPDAFEKATTVWAQTLVQHFRSLATRDGSVLNWSEPEKAIADANAILGDGAADRANWASEFQHLISTALSRGQNLHHPRYIGHQVPASIPIAALFDAVGTATNQVMAIYEMGPWATAAERTMVERLGAEIGFEKGTFGGLITSGGSLANLTAMLTARNVALRDVWKHGIDDARRLAFVVQSDVHYCVTRTAGILGIGTDQIMRVEVDDKRKMRVDHLRKHLEDAKSDGRIVVAVAAGACATPIGAFDPLSEIADVCDEHNVWLHVDAAHGGGALMSHQHRHLLRGIDRADSVVWDAHKMLFMPALCAFVFYKNKEHRFAAFEQDAPYLFDPSNPGIAEYDMGTQTVECTKRAAAYGLWGIWSLFGRQVFTDLVEVTFAVTQSLHEMLTDADDFEPLHQPECNIQAFRYIPSYTRIWPLEKLGAFQLELRRQLIRSGKAYIVPIKLDGVGALRATVMNPMTTMDDLAAMLDAVRETAITLSGEYRP